MSSRPKAAPAKIHETPKPRVREKSNMPDSVTRSEKVRRQGAHIRRSEAQLFPGCNRTSGELKGLDVSGKPQSAISNSDEDGARNLITCAEYGHKSMNSALLSGARGLQSPKISSPDCVKLAEAQAKHRKDMLDF
jgi:hypothetical protein